MRKVFFLAAIAALSASCLKIGDPVIIDIRESYLAGPGLFVLNEGNFRSGNGSLSFFSYDSSKLYNKTFLAANQRALGDVPYSMDFIGNEAYIVVNNSGKVEVAGRYDLKSKATIDNLTAPRYISFVTDKKAYITSLYSDSVTILDLASKSVSGYINMKHPSEAIAATLSQAFIAHWAGGNKIFVINISDDTVVDSVEVGMEPESMVIDVNNTLWVLCNGGWQREHFAELIGINIQSHNIEKQYTFPLITDSPSCLQIDGPGENLYYILGGVRKMNIYASGLPQSTFIPGLNRNFYKVAVNPVNSDIFVTDASDYQNKGSLLWYNRQGGLLSEMEADIIPGGMCFKLETSPVIQ